MQDIRNKRVTVAGLGHFGGQIAAARWLVEQGAGRVLVTDKAKPEKLAEAVKQLEGLPIEFRLGEHRDEDFTTADLVVTSPAIPPNNAFLAKSRDAGVPITTEIRLFIERCPATIIGVTGTKGKSTTTAMLGDILRQRFTTWVGGNIGKSLLFDLPRIEKRDLVLLELSSFMLHHLGEMRWSPHVGVITMIAADHLDWHGSVEEYAEAKKNITRFQRADDYLVVNEENDASRAIASTSAANIVRFGIKGRRRFELRVPGEHNQLNAQAAFAAAGVVGMRWDEAQEALTNFHSLPHRLALVHERDGIRYIDDSIATIPDAAVAALESFPAKTVIQIVGGYDKKLPLTAMCAALVERAKAVLCIGDTGKVIADAIAQTTYTGAATAYRCGDLATAMKIARQIAARGDVVLLSPGCASYDQFDNFEQRGEKFARLAKDR